MTERLRSSEVTVPEVVHEADLVAKTCRYYLHTGSDPVWAPPRYDQQDYLVDLFTRMANEVNLPSSSPLWDWIDKVRSGSTGITETDARRVLERMIEMHYGSTEVDA